MKSYLSMGALLVALVGVRAAIVSRAGRPPFVAPDPSLPGAHGRVSAPRWPAVMPAARPVPLRTVSSACPAGRRVFSSTLGA